MITSVPDNPIDDLLDDGLGRADFVQHLGGIILNAPKDASLRIGVYGEWGEGKTSVLKLVERDLRAAGHACVWLYPWTAENHQEVLESLIKAIATELKLDLSKLNSVNRARRMGGWARAAAVAQPLAKTADAVLGRGLERLLEKQTEKQVERLIEMIRTKLGERRLIVFVDDMDRVRPDLVPALLLMLREALDRPNYFFVMAISPSVVERGLQAVHNAWGDPGQFLEKIVELPQYLPPLKDEQRRSFAARLILTASDSLDQAALSDIASILPDNPRRLKLFVRYLASLGGLLRRFGREELDWRLFYLCQLLRLEFPEETQKMLTKPAVLQDLQFGRIRDDERILARTGGSKDDRLANRPENECISVDHPAKHRFHELCEAIRQRGLVIGRYGAADTLRLPDVVPAITWHEASEFMDLWLASDRLKRDELLHELLNRFDSQDHVKLREVWASFLSVRDSHLGGTVDKDMEHELMDGLAVASSLAALLGDWSRGEFGFRTGALAADEWLALLKHCSAWANFTKLHHYAEVRAAERALLKETADLLSESQRPEILLPLLRWREERELGKGREFSELLDALIERVSSEATAYAVSAFREPEALEAAWGDTRNPALKYLLFDPNSPVFQSEDGLDGLIGLASQAASEEGVQRNFLVYLRQLCYGATEGGSFSPSACRDLLQRRDLTRLLWQAATVKPLNPRTAGTLDRYRTFLLQLGLTADDLPLPTWWRSLQEVGFFGAAADEAPYPQVEDPQGGESNSA